MVTNRRRSLCALAAFFLVHGMLVAQDPAPKNDKAPSAPHVSMTVDFGDGVEKRFTSVPWRDKLTVLDVVKFAQSHPRGIRVELRGEGASALLLKIDDLTNQGRGKNWVYRVNGKLANVGIGAKQLNAGDSVLWKFEEYR